MEEEANEETQSTIPTFQRKPGQTPKISEMGVGLHKSLHVIRQSKRRRREHRGRELFMKMKKTKDQEVTVKDENNNGGCVQKEEEDGGDDDDEREEIERKVQALQRIVPGGESLGVEKLFDETGGYIVALQYQIKTLRALTSFFERLEKEKAKFGG